MTSDNLNPPTAYTDLLQQATIHRQPVSGLEVQVHVWGEGKPCYVLLHGGYGSWAHWIRVIPQLAQEGTVIVPDMPGFGYSDTPPEPHSAEGVAELLVGALTPLLQRRRVVLSGFSFGGAIAGHVAQRLGEQIQHLLLIGPGGLGAPRGTMQDLVRRTPAMSRSEIVAAHRRNLEILMLSDPADVDELALFIQETNTQRHRLKSRPISATDTLARALERLHCPITFLFGTADASVGEYLDARLTIISEVAPHATVETISDRGHWLMWEESALVSDRLRSAAGSAEDTL